MKILIGFILMIWPFNLINGRKYISLMNNMKSIKTNVYKWKFKDVKIEKK
jgi:hypothetical protein